MIAVTLLALLLPFFLPACDVPSATAPNLEVNPVRSPAEWIRRMRARAATPATPKRKSVKTSAPEGKEGLRDLLGHVLTNGLILTLSIVAAIGLGMLTAWSVGRINPKTQIILAGFTGPFNQKSADSTVLARQASDLFSDDLNEIIEVGRSYAGTSQRFGSKSPQGQPLDQVPQIPISRTYGIELNGISIDQVINIWNRTRYTQETVSGDIIPASAGEGHYVLYVSWRTENATYHWTTSPFSGNEKELQAAAQDAAIQFASETNPEIAGRYFLSQAPNSPDAIARAIAVFDRWLGREPDRPEPYFYLAKSYDAAASFVEAMPFALRAEQLINHAPRHSRRSLQTSINLAKSLQYFATPDPGGNGFTAFVNQQLPQNASALSNLGLRYIQLQKYKDAETILEKAHNFNPGDPVVDAGLGKAHEADGDFLNAAIEYRTALALHPTSSAAVADYLSALNKLKDYSDAAAYCRSWIYPAAGVAGIVSDKDSVELYLSCAQAEAQLSNVAKSAMEKAQGVQPLTAQLQIQIDDRSTHLYWYYLQALTRTQSLSDVSPLRDHNTLFAVHGIICHLPGEASSPEAIEENGEWVRAATNMTTLAQKSDKTIAQTCQAVLDRYRKGNRSNGQSTVTVIGKSTATVNGTLQQKPQ